MDSVDVADGLAVDALGCADADVDGVYEIEKLTVTDAVIVTERVGVTVGDVDCVGVSDALAVTETDAVTVAVAVADRVAENV